MQVREPDAERDIPGALFGGVLSIIGIYLLVNLALLYVLPLSRVAGEELAVGAAAQAIFGARGDTIIRALTIISMLSGINAYHLMATRVLFAMSRDRLFSSRGARVNLGGTPTVALSVSTAVAVLFILSGTFEKVIAVLAFFFVANYTLSFVSLFVLRRREPELARPYARGATLGRPRWRSRARSRFSPGRGERYEEQRLLPAAAGCELPMLRAVAAALQAGAWLRRGGAQSRFPLRVKRDSRRAKVDYAWGGVAGGARAARRVIG